MKQVNRYTSNEFHDWQRKNIANHFVLQDLDTWALVWSDSSKDYEPFALVELKRSSFEPRKWTPWKEDLPNYMALMKVAKKAKLPLWIIYFQKGVTISDNTPFRVFLVENVTSGSDWISYKDKIMTAKEFRDSYPNIFKGVI